MIQWFRRLVIQLWLPVVVFTLLLLVIIGIYLPGKQKEALTQFNQFALNDLVKTLTVSVETSLEEDNYQLLTRSISRITADEKISFAAIVINDNNQSEVLVSYPDSIPHSMVLAPDPIYMIARDTFALTNISGYVVIASNNATLNKEIREIQTPIYFFLSILFVLSIILYYIVASRITKPIVDSAEAAKRLAVKDYQAAMPESNGLIEIEQLTGSLKKLRESLISQRDENQRLQNNMASEIKRQTIELSQAVANLERSQQITESVINTALDAVITADDEGRVIKWNRSASEIFGYTPEEAIGNLLTDLIIPSQMADLHTNGMNHYKQTGEGPVLNKKVEIIAVTKAGKQIDVELYITPIKIGAITIFSSFIRDITEDKRIKQSLEEQRVLLNRTLNSIPIDIYLKNRNNAFVFANKSFLTRINKTEEECLYKQNKDLFEGEVLETLDKEDTIAWSDPQLDIKELVRATNEGESTYIVGRNIIDIYFGNDLKTQFLLSFAIDISKTKEAEKQLRKALKAKDEFLSTMSHEIRTPLHSIIGLSELIHERIKTPEHQEMLQSILYSSKHLVGLINDILDFSKITAGKLSLLNKPVNINQLLHQVTKQFTSAADQKGVTMVLQSHTLDRYVITDEMRLSQVLNNLLSNAIKFTNKGTVSLVVTPEKVYDNAIDLKFAVVDTGKGIAAEKLESILEPFSQENNSISREYGGTGLGLSIVKSLLQLMDGELQIESTLKKGSTFSFTLHFVLGSSIIAQKAREMKMEQERIPLRILYVEDMIPNQFLMKKMVMPWGVDLKVATTASEALTISNQHQFDLILMDIQMPGVDGIEAFHMIRRDSTRNANTPVIAFTANAETSDIKRYNNIGFFDVLTKPIAAKALNNYLIHFIETNESITK